MTDILKRKRMGQMCDILQKEGEDALEKARRYRNDK